MIKLNNRENMKTFVKLATGMLFLVSCGGNISDKVSTLSIPDKYEQRVDSVLKLMTLDEKNWAVESIYRQLAGNRTGSGRSY